MIMWILTCVVLFASGYAASIYSWPVIKVSINGVTVKAEKLRDRAASLEAELRHL